MPQVHIYLSSDERFGIWGKQVTRLTVTSISDTEPVSLRGRNGFIGTVTPAQVPEVMNAITARRDWIRCRTGEGLA